MPITFEQPQAYDPGVSQAYGSYLADLANRDYGLKAAALAQHAANQGGHGGGGGAFTGGGGGGGGVQVLPEGRDYQSEVNAHLALSQGQLSQAEEMRLQRMNQGIAAVQDQIDSGELEEDDGNELIGQLRTGIDPLQRRQAQAHLQGQELANKQREAQIKNDFATQQAHNTLNARSLNDRSVIVEDPVIRAQAEEEYDTANPEDAYLMQLPDLDPAQRQEIQDRREQAIKSQVRARGGHTHWIETQPGRFARSEPTAAQQRDLQEQTPLNPQQEVNLRRHYETEVSREMDRALAPRANPSMVNPKPAWMTEIEEVFPPESLTPARRAQMYAAAKEREVQRRTDAALGAVRGRGRTSGGGSSSAGGTAGGTAGGSSGGSTPAQVQQLRQQLAPLFGNPAVPGPNEAAPAAPAENQPDEGPATIRPGLWRRFFGS